jgi:hypothetical protein
MNQFADFENRNLQIVNQPMAPASQDSIALNSLLN